jgi:hypothetical protein
MPAPKRVEAITQAVRHFGLLWPAEQPGSRPAVHRQLTRSGFGITIRQIDRTRCRVEFSGYL